jgi:hypothetical protein
MSSGVGNDSVWKSGSFTWVICFALGLPTAASTMTMSLMLVCVDTTAASVLPSAVAL